MPPVFPAERSLWKHRDGLKMKKIWNYSTVQVAFTEIEPFYVFQNWKCFRIRWMFRIIFSFMSSAFAIFFHFHPKLHVCFLNRLYDVHLWMKYTDVDLRSIYSGGNRNDIGDGASHVQPNSNSCILSFFLQKNTVGC